MKRLIATKFVLIASLLFSANVSVAAEKRLLVSTSPLSALLIKAKNSVPANVISLNHATISAEITGRALTLKVEAGDYVKKGNKLASLDCRSYSLAKKQAEAALKVAHTQLNYSNKQFQRNNNLVKRGIISRESFEKAEASKLTSLADIALKKASIETSNLAISRCHIYAPFSGQITKRLVQKGQLVTPGTPLFQLMQSNKLEIKADLSPENIAKLGDSPKLMFKTDNQTIAVKVRKIIGIVDETTRTQEVRLSLSSKVKVPAGLAGRVEWNSGEKLLPAEYIVRRNRQLGVMLANNIIEGIGSAKFHALRNAKEGQAAIINLPSNTPVIIKNRYQVIDGQAIKVK